MLLTRRACYGLLAAQHLAEHAGEGSFSSNDLAEFYGLPHEALAKILQRLATAGVLISYPRDEGRIYTRPRPKVHFRIRRDQSQPGIEVEPSSQRTPATLGDRQRLPATAHGESARRRYAARAYD